MYGQPALSMLNNFCSAHVNGNCFINLATECPDCALAVVEADLYCCDCISVISLFESSCCCARDSVAGTGVRSAGRRQRWSWKINQTDHFLCVTAQMIDTFSASASGHKELLITLALNTTKVSSVARASRVAGTAAPCVDPEIDWVELHDRSKTIADRLGRSTRLLTPLSIWLNSGQRRST